MYPEDIKMMDKVNRCHNCPKKLICGNPFNSVLTPHKPFIAVVLFEPDYNLPDFVMSG